MRITLCLLAMTAVYGQHARSSVRTTDSRPTTENEAVDYWSHYVATVDSFPSASPSAKPSREPSAKPSAQPSHEPSAKPSREPSAKPSREPSAKPSQEPSAEPSQEPSAGPSSAPSKEPSAAPSSKPSAEPSSAPSSKPSASPSHAPSSKPSAAPSHAPSSKPSAAPSHAPSSKPSAAPSTAPSEQPTVAATIPPTPRPTPRPTPAPVSPAPTGECGVDVIVEPECPALPCNFDRCLERPFRMTFRVDTRTCDQSVLKRCPGVDPDTCACVRDTVLPPTDWPAQKFTCTNFNGGPPAVGTNGTFWVQATPQKDTSVIYFQGPVATPGGLFNAVAPAGETQVAADTSISLFACANAACTGPGALLQQIIFDSSCTQQLYLLDIFGSFQLIELQSTNNGVVGFGINPTVGFTLQLNPTVTAGPLTLNFLSIVVLSETVGALPPQIFNFDVAGRVIPPPFTTDATVNLVVGEPFNVITTVGGTLNGLGCFDTTNSIIECDATIEPDNPCPPDDKKGSKKGKGDNKGSKKGNPKCPDTPTAAPKNSKKGGTGAPKATAAPKANKGDNKKNRRTQRRLVL